MGRFLAFIALIAIVSTASCPGPECVAVGHADSALLPAEGAWELVVDHPELSGACQAVDTQALVATRMRGELGVLGNGMVHLDLDGVHLEGTVQGEQLYAEGWSDAGFMRHEGEDVRLPLGMTLDAWMDTRDSFQGELLLVIESEHGVCEAVAWVRADLLPWSEGRPQTCDEPVPLDEDTPVRHPEADEQWECE